MSSILQCQYEIEQYKSLKLKLDSIVSKLSSALNSVDDLNDEIKGRYRVNDDYTPIVFRISDYKTNMENDLNNLKKNVLPAIDLAISDLENEIEILGSNSI